MEGRETQIFVFALYGVFAALYIAPATSVTQDLVHPGMRAFSYGMCVIVQHLCGDVWSPWLVGLASDRFGLSRAMWILPAFGILASLFFYGSARFLVRDLALVEKVELNAE
jgi:fucose permease